MYLVYTRAIEPEGAKSPPFPMILTDTLNEPIRNREGQIMPATLIHNPPYPPQFSDLPTALYNSCRAINTMQKPAFNSERIFES